MYWLDSHCHINDAQFNDDLDVVLENMVKADVKKAMIISSYIEDYQKAKEIKHKDIEFKRALGFYPGDADNFSEELFNQYKEKMKEEECIAVGEIGLDYHYGKDTKELQKEIFKRQCAYAKEIDKPIIVHSREAAQDTYDILKAYKNRGVIHCFSDSKEMAKEYVKLGFYISLSGTVTFKNAKEPLEVIKSVPLDRLLIETDCPYLAPVPKRGLRNEPSFVIYTGEKIASELGLNIELFKAQINDNYERLFG